MANYFLASVGRAEAFEKKADGNLELLFVSRTLTDSAIDITTTTDDLRGGTGAPIQARFRHDTTVAINLTDIMFREEYLSAQLGANFNATSNAYFSESNVVVATANQIALKKPVVKMNVTQCEAGEVSEIIWAKKESEGDTGWKSYKGTYSNGTFTVSDTKNLETGTYCVRYFAGNMGAEVASVVSEILPKELYLIITCPLFAGDACSASKGTKVGTITFEVPRFGLDGGLSLSLNMSSNATISLAGQALANDGGCDENGSELLRMIKVIDAESDNPVVDIYVPDPEITLASGATKALEVFGIHKNNALEALKLTDARLSYEATGNVTCTSGIITAGATGTGVVTVKFAEADIHREETVDVTVE